MIKDHPRVLTSDWTYLRYHGDHYAETYSPQKLAAEAKWIKGQLVNGNDVFAYFNNDAEGYALKNAADLKRYLGLSKDLSSKRR